jgi:endonuclease YncB( thermonuclease family)
MAFTHDFKKFPELTNSQMGLYYFDSPHQQINEDFRAKVVKVIDGDTIRVKTDFRDFNFPIRFSNILAAEMNEEGGRTSKNWLTNKILGKNIDVMIDQKNRVGKWGRLLGKIILDGVDIGENSIQEGKSIGIQEEKGEIEDLILILNL